jgi:hypothetical protein
MKRVMLMLIATVFCCLIAGQALAQLDPSASTVFWKAEGKWYLDSIRAKWQPRPFTITLFASPDGSGYWAEYRPDNGSPTWAQMSPVREKVELMQGSSGRYFSMSGGYRYHVDNLEAVFETQPTAKSDLKKTGGL